MWIIYLLEFVVVVIVSVLWVRGITNMHEKYPDYKGKGQGLNFDDEDDNTQDN